VDCSIGPWEFKDRALRIHYKKFEPEAKELRVTSNLALHESALFVIVQNAMLEAENNSEEPEKWMAVL
jgi:hypothetical protein